VATIRTTKQVQLTTIQPHPENYNHGDAGAISQSLQHHGQYRAIVVSEVTGNILAGNHTYLAAQMNGETKMLAHLIPDLTPEDEIRIMVADNQYAKLAYTDDNLLSELLQELSASDDGLIATGWDGDGLDNLLTDLAADDMSVYTNKVEAPVYEPTEEVPPPITDLIDRTRTDRLKAALDKTDLPNDLQAFLHSAAERHTVLRFDLIAEYYAHAPADVQRLFEESALVIVDFDQAIEQGFVQMQSSLTAIFEDEYPDA